MSKRKQKMELELERERRTGVRVKYLPRNFLWNVLAVTLAFLLGLFSALAGLLGVGFFYLTRPANTVIPNYELFLREEYASKSLLDLTGDVAKLVQEIAAGGGDFSLAKINEITPVLENNLVPLADTLKELGVNVDLDVFMTTPVSGMGPYFRDDVLMKVELGKALKVTPDGNPLLLALCYGEKGEDYTVTEDEEGNSVIVMNEGKSPTTVVDLLGEGGGILNKLTVEAALGVSASSNAAMRYLAYGTEGVNYTVGEDDEIVMLENPITGEKFRKKTISDLTADGSTAIDDAKISDLIDTGSDNGILNAIRDWRIADLRQQSRIERLKIGQVVDLEGATSGLMKAIADWRIKDLTDRKRIDSLTLGDVLTVDGSSPQLLRALADAPLGEIGERANGLRLADMLGAEDLANNKLLKNLGQSSLSTLADDIARLSVKDVFGDEMYLHMPVKAGKYASYRDFLDGYDHLAESAEDRMYMPFVNPDGGTEAEYTEHYRYLKGGEKTALLRGFLGEKNGTAVFAASDVYHDGSGCYAKDKLEVTPVFSYKRVDFENGGAAVDADYAAELRAGWVNGNVYGAGDEASDSRAYVRENGEIVRYYPESEAWKDPAGTGEQRCYPLLSDGYGVYCLIATADGKQVRADFDEVVTGYTAGGRSLALGENGGAMYEGTEKTVYSERAEDGSVKKYIVLRIPVEEGYYEEADPSVNTLASTPSDGLDAEDVETYWTATWTEGGEQHSDEEVDRYLDGIWYLLLGGTKYGEDGKVTEIVDGSSTPVLNMAALVTDTAAIISDTPLWELYLHGVIKADPYSPVLGGHNLNELTITKVIEYAKNPGGFSWGS